MSTYLLNRQGTYYLRIRIPSDLPSVFPSKDIVKSLKTKDKKVAHVSSLGYLHRITQIFSLVRAGFISTDKAQEHLRRLLGKKPESVHAIQTEPLAKANTKAQSRRILLSTIASQYIKDHQDAWTCKTVMETKGVFRLVVDVMGDVDARTIDRQKVRELRDKLSILPSNLYKRYPAQSPLQVLKLITEGAITTKSMSTNSINKHISKLSSLMIYCVKEGVLESNPATSLMIKRSRRADEERKAYTEDDLRRIVSNLPKAGHIPERYWVPLIGLYSGMRLDEICQLYTNDVKELDGVWCLEVNDCLDKKIKTLSSKRIVPIHPRLIELGFLGYVSKCSEEGRLWSNLTWCKVNGYSNSLGKWYQRFNRKHVTDDPLKTFHSLRHTFADTLKQHGAQESMISELMGHANDSITTGRYGKRYQPKVLFEAISMISFQ